jgi:hypothetical protein
VLGWHRAEPGVASAGFGTFHLIEQGQVLVRGYVQRWQISAAVGASGECYRARWSTAGPPAGSPGPPAGSTECAPLGTPGGTEWIVALPGLDYAGLTFVGYAFAVGPDVTSVTATTPGERPLSLTPVDAGGRRYVAFTAAPMTRFTWYGAGGRVLASATQLPSAGWIQFKA